MTLAPRVLYVAWQDTNSRKILPVARVLCNVRGYEFTYIRAVDDAIDHASLDLDAAVWLEPTAIPASL